MSQADEKTLELEIKNIEKKYILIKHKIKLKKSEELDRVGKEFSLNNYEKRFKVS
jgi:hypothetical protein